ncbi:hypothetical protein WR25_24459 [Diploscapter pachys]|uniref:Uncharacterized protein n=1 Tax=Diploscapter pachys TaxID=2018661 RepID=A0A2A2LJQ9_9BILA|nr:hypothetical protein WR25_24459 [Diploscapter pachys]
MTPIRCLFAFACSEQVPITLSRSASVLGPQMYLYAPQGTLDPRGLSVIDPRLQMDRVSLVDPRLQAPAPEYTMPIWYHVPPQPIYIPIGQQLMPYQTKALKKPRDPSLCSEICCGGIAQLLWSIISLILLGVIASLILALFYV